MHSRTLTPDLLTDEVDLRAFARVIKQHYRSIVAISVVAAIFGLGASLASPKTYEAQALVALTRPHYVLNFEPRFQATTDQDPNQTMQSSMSRALTTLATSDDVLSAVASSAHIAERQGLRAVDFLRQSLTVKPTSDSSLVALTVRAEDAQSASALANVWADVLIVRARSIYGLGSSDVADFESRSAAAGLDLSNSATALAEFQARNQTDVLKSQLEALGRDQQTYLSDREVVNRSIQDVQGLRSHLGGYPADGKVSLGDDLTALLLETKTYNANSVIPIQLQVTGDQGVSNKSAAQLQAFLDDLESQLNRRAAFDQSRLGDIGPRLLAVQGQLQRVKNEEDGLVLTLDLAKDTYRALERQTEEVRIAAEGTDGQVKIASRSLPPSRPVTPHIILTTVVAGIAGCLMGLLLALAREWWGIGPARSVPRLPGSRSGRLPIIAGGDGGQE